MAKTALLPTQPASYMSGARINKTTHQGVNGWVPGPNGAPVREKSMANDSVGESLVPETPVYRSPDQIRAEEKAQSDAKLAAAQAAEHEAAVAARTQVQQILRERSTQGLTPTTDELRLIANTPLGTKSEQTGFAEAALFARALTAYDRRAAYAAFETERAQRPTSEPFDSRVRPSIVRRTVILDKGFRPIGEIRSWAARDAAERHMTGDLEFTLGQYAARVFRLGPAPVDVWGRIGEQTMAVTDEARSFDDGTHPDTPHLFTVGPAAEWVPPKPSLLSRLLGR